MMFLRDRGAYNTLYFTAFYGALMVRLSITKLEKMAVN